MQRFVTHYLVGYTDDQHWVSLYYVTKDTSGNYYFGFEDVVVSVEEISRRIAAGEVAPVKSPWPMNEGQELWRAPYGDIWLTQGPHPLNDDRVLVQEGALPQIISTKEMIHRRSSKPEVVYVPDSFVTQPIYGLFATHAAKELATINGAGLHRIAGKVAEWDLLASKVEGHTVDFCGLPYNLHQSRAPRHSVVQFGWQPTYTCYYSMKSERLTASGHALFQSGLPARQRIERALNDDPDLQIGTVSETTAFNELLSVFRFFPRLAEHDGFVPMSQLDHLKEWIAKKPDTRVIICDHSLAEKLDKVDSSVPTIDGAKITWEHGTERSTLKFTEPLPVGFLYTRGDDRWAADIRAATRNALIEIVFRDDNYEKLRKALYTLRVELMDKWTLCREFDIEAEHTKLA